MLRHLFGEGNQCVGGLVGVVGGELRPQRFDGLPRFVAQGYDCGSGPTESQCGTTTARVKGPGMRWDTDNADAMMALTALDNCRLWNDYWKLQRAA
ncbi:MAG: hypothetical protein ACLFVY_06885 [Phycisphaerae bacterium]